jgi:hypothetical protein
VSLIVMPYESFLIGKLLEALIHWASCLDTPVRATHPLLLLLKFLKSSLLLSLLPSAVDHD